MSGLVLSYSALFDTLQCTHRQLGGLSTHRLPPMFVYINSTLIPGSGVVGCGSPGYADGWAGMSTGEPTSGNPRAGHESIARCQFLLDRKLM